MMIRTGFIVTIICLLAIHTGCGRETADRDGNVETEEFDFTRYENQERAAFSAAYGLKEQDFSEEGPGNYRIRKELPFLDTMASYRLVCDEEDRIVMISVSIQLEDGRKDSFDWIQRLRDSFNGLADVEYLYDQEEYQGTRNINTYKTAEELETAILQVKEEPETEREKHFFTLRGVWNRKDGVQVDMQYTFRLEDEKAGIELRFCNSDSPLAVSFDQLVEEEPDPAA